VCNLINNLQWIAGKPTTDVIMTVGGRRAKTQREPRRQLHKQPAWITADSGLTRRECLVLEVSPGGAKIMTDVPINDSDSFELVLVPNHPKRQPCEVVWRRGNTYGIKFLF